MTGKVSPPASKRRRLVHSDWDGVFKSGKVWTLYERYQTANFTDQERELKTWYFAPLWWARLSCVAHGWGWPEVVR